MQLTEIELQYIVVDNMGLGHFFYYFSQAFGDIYRHKITNLSFHYLSNDIKIEQPEVS